MTRDIRSLFDTAPKAVARAAFTRVNQETVRPEWAQVADVVDEETVRLQAIAAARRAELEGEYARGLEEGTRIAQAELEKVRERLHEAVGQLVAARENMLARSEDDLVDLSLLIAESLVAGDAEARGRFTRTMVTEALTLLKQADDVRLRVHPSERAAVEAALPPAEGNRRVTLIDDPSIGEGGVVAECEIGRVDATFTRALNDIARGLRPQGLRLRLAAGEQR